MKIETLSEIPEWDDDDFERLEESWRPNPTREACKLMYQQWNTVMIVLKAALDSLPEPGGTSPFSAEMQQEEIAMVMGDAFEVAVKIRSSESGLYTIRMENAAIIRKNAQFIMISTNGFNDSGGMHPEHRQIVRNEIDKFRALFKRWVSTFTKDEFEDEWGLFV